MANSPQAVKEKADYISKTNDEDGVAAVINKFILGEVI
jgi:hydroxymethylpyrimidine pyrophosphatase-like HAD family hydrolase